MDADDETGYEHFQESELAILLHGLVHARPALDPRAWPTSDEIEEEIREEIARRDAQSDAIRAAEDEADE